MLEDLPPKDAEAADSDFGMMFEEKVHGPSETIAADVFNQGMFFFPQAPKNHIIV
jgi:hypothetical protein